MVLSHIAVLSYSVPFALLVILSPAQAAHVSHHILFRRSRTLTFALRISHRVFIDVAFR